MVEAAVRKSLIGLTEEREYKDQLNEGFSNILYHNTPLNKLEFISQDGCFLLHKVNTDTKNGESSLENLTNKLVSNNGSYYLSFSRERNSKIGYAGYKNGNLNHLRKKPALMNFSKGYFARFEIDGKLLEQYLAKDKKNQGKGAPIDYYRENPSMPVFTAIKVNIKNTNFKDVNGVKCLCLKKAGKFIPLYVMDKNGNYVKARSQDGNQHFFKRTLKTIKSPADGRFRDDLAPGSKTQIRQSEDRLVYNNDRLYFYNKEEDIDYGFIKHIDIFLPPNAEKTAPKIFQSVYEAISNPNWSFAKMAAARRDSDFIRIYNTRNDYDSPIQNLQYGGYSVPLTAKKPKTEKKEILNNCVINKSANIAVATYLITKLVNVNITEDTFKRNFVKIMCDCYSKDLSNAEIKELKTKFNAAWDNSLEACEKYSESKLEAFYRDVINDNFLKQNFIGKALNDLKDELVKVFQNAKVQFNKKFAKSLKQTKISRYIYDFLNVYKKNFKAR
jgi:hypothetical protein